MATSKDKTNRSSSKKINTKFVQILLSEGFKLNFSGDLEFRIKMKTGDDLIYTITKEHFNTITFHDIFSAMTAKAYVEGINRMKNASNNTAGQLIGSLRT